MKLEVEPNRVGERVEKAPKGTLISPWVFLMAAFVLIPLTLSAADNSAALLTTSIFAPESTPAHSIVRLSLFVLAITGTIFVVVFSLIIYAVVRFRRRPEDDGKEPAQVYGSNPVEMAWTVVPIIIVVVLTLTTARIIHEIQDAPKPPGAVDVQVIGHQFWWEFRYPKYGVVTANELHVPVSLKEHPTPTFLDLRSADVVHSFWVPRLAGKTELVPNKVNTMWIDPERTGLYLGQCAKYCGTQHSWMLLRVYVDTPEEFARWLQEQKASASSEPGVAAGRRIFERTVCINCHTVNGTAGTGRFGPDLTHLMSRDTLGSGVVKNTRENLRAWIKAPDQFKPGVLMPAMNLNDPEIDQLVDYLVTLK
jgi:cytochrome c oxidase subunit 2